VVSTLRWRRSTSKSVRPQPHTRTHTDTTCAHCMVCVCTILLSGGGVVSATVGDGAVGTVHMRYFKGTGIPATPSEWVVVGSLNVTVNPPSAQTITTDIQTALPSAAIGDIGVLQLWVSSYVSAQLSSGLHDVRCPYLCVRVWFCMQHERARHVSVRRREACGREQCRPRHGSCPLGAVRGGVGVRGLCVVERTPARPLSPVHFNAFPSFYLLSFQCIPPFYFCCALHRVVAPVHISISNSPVSTVYLLFPQACPAGTCTQGRKLQDASSCKSLPTFVIA
jgi:hypothetical protein